VHDLTAPGQHGDAAAVEGRIPRFQGQAVHLGHAGFRLRRQGGLVRRAVASDIGKVQNGWYHNDPDHPDKESAKASDQKLGTALWDLSHRIIKERLGEDALVDRKPCE
jgi:hypothetical protein